VMEKLDSTSYPRSIDTVAAQPAVTESCTPHTTIGGAVTSCWILRMYQEEFREMGRISLR
jgi:hypothetical protein